MKGTKYYDFSFSVNEPATIYYRLLGSFDSFGAVPSTTEPGWYEDTGTLINASTGKNGTIEIEYWARDAAGNASLVRSTGSI